MLRPIQTCMCLALSLALAASAAPAGASEVVKLARLVVSGKRSAPESPRVPPAEVRSGAAVTPHHGGGNGGSDAAGTAPAPARGVS